MTSTNLSRCLIFPSGIRFLPDSNLLISVGLPECIPNTYIAVRSNNVSLKYDNVQLYVNLKKVNSVDIRPINEIRALFDIIMQTIEDQCNWRNC